MVASVLTFVVIQLLLLLSTSADSAYSSVLTMNAVRLGGLLCACFNGLYALFVLLHYADHPATHEACSTSPPLGSSGSGTDVAIRLVNDYTTFFGLVAGNVLGMACGAQSSFHSFCSVYKLKARCLLVLRCCMVLAQAGRMGSPSALCV